MYILSNALQFRIKFVLQLKSKCVHNLKYVKLLFFYLPFELLSSMVAKPFVDCPKSIGSGLTTTYKNKKIQY